MDTQAVMNFISVSAIAVGGWFAREIWDSLKELRKNTHEIEKELRELYVRRDDLREVRVEMSARFGKAGPSLGWTHVSKWDLSAFL